MHLLYVDESGSVADASQRYFILAGVCVFDRTTHWVEQKLNEIATRFDATIPHELELHGSPMHGGNKRWRQFPQAERRAALVDALREGIANQSPSSVRLFGVVIEKASAHGDDAVKLAFEQLASRFDRFLWRKHKNGETERGLMLFDESSTEQRIQRLAREFKYDGHRFGKLRNFAEVSVFLDSRASRLIQLADLVAYAMFRSFEHDDHTYFDVIRHRFDYEGGVEHGLYVQRANAQPSEADNSHRNAT